MELIEEPKAKVIYSKRYPSIKDIIKKAELEEAEEDNIMSKKYIATKWNEFVARYNYKMKNYEYVLRPDKMENLNNFINLAIELSTRYEISMDIKDHHYYTSVTMHFDCGSCGGDFLPMIAQLISMSDEIDSGIFTNEPYDFSISLDYYTYDRYLPGRRKRLES